MKDLLEMYRNYLFALEMRKKYGDKYGDTEERIKQYEEMLGIKKPINRVLKKEKYNIKDRI